MSKLDQIHQRPASLIMSTRADARYIATLINFWRKQDENPRSISELLRLSVESFAEFLVLNNQVAFVQNHTDAFQILDRTGMTVKKTNPKHIAEILSKENSSSLENVLKSPKIDQSHQETLSHNPVSPEGPEMSSVMAELETRLNSDLDTRVKEAKERTEEFKKSLGIPQEGISQEEE